MDWETVVLIVAGGGAVAATLFALRLASAGLRSLEAQAQTSKELARVTARTRATAQQLIAPEPARRREPVLVVDS
jgi:hypothetical protein